MLERERVEETGIIGSFPARDKCTKKAFIHPIGELNGIVHVFDTNKYVCLTNMSGVNFLDIHSKIVLD